MVGRDTILERSGSPFWLPVSIVCYLLHNVLETRLVNTSDHPSSVEPHIFSIPLFGRKLHCSRSQLNSFICHQYRL
ncbi:hypothetical protein FVER53590_29721 [Fusarium verticillioides]|nr:hypothetical protein FVER53590_29721 [Fusarium verticillioides]